MVVETRSGAALVRSEESPTLDGLGGIVIIGRNISADFVPVGYPDYAGITDG